MIVIADSGSTKTQWTLLHNDGQQQSLLGVGLNPRTTSDEAFLTALQVVKGVDHGHCYFYGAGCGTDKAKHHVARLLQTAFPNIEVAVESDLVGACRAVCGNKSGIVGILGTGSNACYYNGTKVAAQIPSLGYLLGDEGSGNHIGKHLLKDYLCGNMPKEINIMFHDSYHITLEECIEHLYRQPNANRYLASFAPFAAEHRHEAYIATLLDEVFDTYIRQQILPLKPYGTTLNLVGSIAAAFAENITAVAAQHAIEIGTLEANPINGLVAYHKATAKQ